MAKKRKNIYFTDRQVERLEQASRQENLSEAELVRRALDAYLAWDGALPIAPNTPAPNNAQRSHPLHE